jgi:hypothetical protein
MADERHASGERTVTFNALLAIAASVLGFGCGDTRLPGLRQRRRVPHPPPHGRHGGGRQLRRANSTPPSSRASPRLCRRSCAMSSKATSRAACFREACRVCLSELSRAKAGRVQLRRARVLPFVQGPAHGARRRQLTGSTTFCQGALSNSRPRCED